MSRDASLYLHDMKAAADAVVRYRGELDRAGVFGSPVVLHAILWNLLVLGEAAKNVPDEVRRQHGAIPWRRIAGFRDVVPSVSKLTVSVTES